MTQSPSLTAFRKYQARLHAGHPLLSVVGGIGTDRREALFEALSEHCSAYEIVEFPKKGGVTYQIDLTRNCTQCHYAIVFLRILETMEKQGRIHSLSTKLWEVSTGSAGIACQRIAHLLGYDTGLIIPQLEETRERALKEMAILYPDRHTVEVVSDDDCFLYDAVGEFQSRLGDTICKTKIPNHSNVRTTPKAIASIMAPIFEKMREQRIQLDAIVMAMGNGTSIVGTMQALKAVQPDQDVALHCFEGLFDPGVDAFDYGDWEPEERVTLYGADGTGGIQDDLVFPNLIKEQYSPMTHSVSRSMWEDLYREYNAGKSGSETHGRTSLAALGIAREIPGNVAVIRYDHYDGRYDPV